MTRFVALLRAVNVGGTGKLPMSELKAMCEASGFTQVQTYIASGNVVFSSSHAAAEVKSRLEARLQRYAGKPVRVVVRTAAQMAAVLASNPYSKAAPNRTLVIFLEQAPPEDALKHVTGQDAEQIALGEKEIYVHYGATMAQSKLKIPAARDGTARNMNTVARLVSLSAK